MLPYELEYSVILLPSQSSNAGTSLKQKQKSLIMV